MARPRFFSPERIETLMHYGSALVKTEPAVPAALRVSGGISLHDRESAYAFACLIMARADELWLDA